MIEPPTTRSARAEHRDRHAFRRRVAEQPLLRRAAQPAQRRSLRDRQPQSRPQSAIVALDERRQREVDVVAAEQQVIADRDPLERRRAGLDPDPNQAEVGRAAADVADERDLAVFERPIGHACSAIHA